MKVQLLVRRPSDEKLELVDIHPSGSYFDESRVLWDQRSGEPFPQEYDAELNSAKSQDEYEKDKLAKRMEALAYLAQTDWYVTRKIETGKDVPAEVATKRVQARLDAGE